MIKVAYIEAAMDEECKEQELSERWYLRDDFFFQDLSKLCQFELVKFFLYLERWSWKYLVLKYVYMCVNSEYYQMVDCKSRPL